MGDRPGVIAPPAGTSSEPIEPPFDLQTSPDPGRSPSRPGPAIALHGLTKRFGERTAFEDLTFEVGRGEVFGMLGPNGAGKTSTVRVLSTLLPPTSGDAEIAGVPLAPGNEREIRRRISVVTETAGLYRRLTVRDNLEFFAGLYGLTTTRSRERISECLAVVGLEDRVDERAGALSKGLRQRAALARALLADPEVLFLDEPSAGLDPAAAAGFRRVVAGLRDRGITVFLTTHQLGEAERLCDRVAIVNTRLASIGSVGALVQRSKRRTIEVAVRGSLADPAALFEPLPGVTGWRPGRGPGVYLLNVEDADAAAPEVARAVVWSGLSLVRLSETGRSLEEAYLDIVGGGP